MHAGRNIQYPAEQGQAGFTLVEVMISVALVLFLIIGVNQVFKMTTDTVGAGQVMSQNIRDSRAAQAVLQADAAAASVDQPMFIIAASRVSAFRNPNDRANDRDYALAANALERDEAIRTIDLNDNNVEGETAIAGEITPTAIYNHRNHRIDRLAFFARDVFSRQTANDRSLVSPIDSSEAWIWYGHLRLENSDGVYFQPGQTSATNRNNFVASQFAVGRMVMLLRDPNTFPAAAVDHIQRTPAIPAGGAAVVANPTLSPLSWESTRTDAASEAIASDGFVWSSRYDLAATTIAQFQKDLDAVAPGQPFWWQRFLYAQTAAAGLTTTPVPLDTLPADYRFRANRLFTKPLDSKKAAELAPILLDGASQFIVEFAGDYVEQNATTGVLEDIDGDGTAAEPDGITDFVIDATISADVRSVRWYGMPRDVAGALAPQGGPDGVISQGTLAVPSVDVVPVRDVRGSAADFERREDVELVDPPGGNYAAPGGMAPNARYTCVWGPDVDLTVDPLPQMLRITIVLEDANGRLAEGQQYEYVIDLPY